MDFYLATEQGDQPMGRQRDKGSFYDGLPESWPRSMPTGTDPFSPTVSWEPSMQQCTTKNHVRTGPARVRPQHPHHPQAVPTGRTPVRISDTMKKHPGRGFNHPRMWRTSLSSTWGILSHYPTHSPDRETHDSRATGALRPVD